MDQRADPGSRCASDPRVGAIPGNEKSIFDWFNRMLAGIFSFVAVYAIFLAMIFLGRGFLQTGTNVWNPPLLGFANTPPIGFITSLLAYGLYIYAPNIPEDMRANFKVDETFFKRFTGTIGEQTRSAVRKIPIVGAIAG